MKSATASQRQFYPNLYSDTIKHAMRSLAFQKTILVFPQTCSIKVHHIKGHFLVSKRVHESMEFGEVLIILIQNDAAVYFVMDIHKADYHSD